MRSTKISRHNLSNVAEVSLFGETDLHGRGGSELEALESVLGCLALDLRLEFHEGDVVAAGDEAHFLETVEPGRQGSKKLVYFTPQIFSKTILTKVSNSAAKNSAKRTIKTSRVTKNDEIEICRENRKRFYGIKGILARVASPVPSEPSPSPPPQPMCNGGGPGAGGHPNTHFKTPSSRGSMEAEKKEKKQDSNEQRSVFLSQNIMAFYRTQRKAGSEKFEEKIKVK